MTIFLSSKMQKCCRMLRWKICCCRNIDCRHQIIFCIRFQILNMLSWWASQAGSRSTTHPTIFHEYFKSIYWINTKTFISKRKIDLFRASMSRLFGCVTIKETICLWHKFDFQLVLHEKIKSSLAATLIYFKTLSSFYRNEIYLLHFFEV